MQDLRRREGGRERSGSGGAVKRGSAVPGGRAREQRATAMEEEEDSGKARSVQLQWIEMEFWDLLEILVQSLPLFCHIARSTCTDRV